MWFRVGGRGFQKNHAGRWCLFLGAVQQIRPNRLHQLFHHVALNFHGWAPQKWSEIHPSQRILSQTHLYVKHAMAHASLAPRSYGCSLDELGMGKRQAKGGPKKPFSFGLGSVMDGCGWMSGQVGLWLATWVRPPKNKVCPTHKWVTTA